ncbi:MAG: serine/threonine protein kinase [Candidatus Obscuribacterales bacterium]|nr:serine/threonine protein kinase [Candidatus Obscuribacterales bacterium]
MLGTLLAGKYELQDKLGQGHLGIVYRARCLEGDNGAEKTYAIKILTKEFSNDKRAIQRFQREANAAGKLDHPNIVKIFDFDGTEDGSFYIVMELIEGKTLRRVIRRSGPLPVKNSIEIFNQVLDALDHFHSRGLVHRDIKPSNIILSNFSTKDEIVKIVDFGLARHIDAAKAAEEKVTLDGFVTGTPAYMSPEQCLGGNVDPRSDLYSLGCVMFRTLTGIAPIPGMTPKETMTNQVQYTALPFDRMPPHIELCEELKDVMKKALSKRPDLRYQNALEMKAALEQILQKY